MRVPLKKEIRHASHSRTESENLVVGSSWRVVRPATAKAFAQLRDGRDDRVDLRHLGKHDWARTDRSTRASSQRWLKS